MTAKAPTCPRCDSNAQVWISNGEWLCHRLGCHVVVDFEPHDTEVPCVDVCRHGEPRKTMCGQCPIEGAYRPKGEPPDIDFDLSRPIGALTTEEKAEREQLSAEATKAFDGTAAEARELLIRFAVSNEYICDTDGLFDSDISRNSAIARLQHGALLACAYTNKDGFRSKEEYAKKETTTLERLNKTLADREKLRGDLKREQDRSMQLIADRDEARKRADRLRGVLVELYKITVGIDGDDIGAGPSDEFLALVPDELRDVLQKLRRDR
jgi:hypothetical protein